MPLRVLIADDDAFMRSVTARVLGAQEGIEVVGEATDAQEAIDLAQRLAPDVVLLDVNMPGGGVAAAAGIRERCENTVTVAFSASADASVEAMRQAGARGYVLKGTPAEELVARLRRAISPPGA